MPPLKYKCFYNDRSTEVEADTSYKAQQKAVVALKVPPKRRYMISVMLLEKGGEAVIHDGAEL